MLNFIGHNVSLFTRTIVDLCLYHHPGLIVRVGGERVVKGRGERSKHMLRVHTARTEGEGRGEGERGREVG